MADKKISELPVASPLSVNDEGVIVQGDVTYHFTVEQLLDFFISNLPTGSIVTFDNSVPSAMTGKNGDVSLQVATGQFYQKVAGAWTLKYTIPAGVVGSTIYYGSGAPSNVTGINGDTYLQTDGGLFYQKVAGAWVLKFSMASGPAGATGPAGANGTNGTNGKTILNGSIPPSNLTDGTDGDFYLNTSNYLLYGPKAAGVWPAGVSLFSSNVPSYKEGILYSSSDARFVYDSVNLTLTFNLNGTDQSNFPYNPGGGNILTAILRQKISGTQYKQKNSFDPIITDNGTNYVSVFFEGIESGELTNYQILLS